MTKKPALEEILAALPDAKVKGRKWTFQEDAAILKFGEAKGFEAIARTIGNVTGVTVRRRFRELKARLKK